MLRALTTGGVEELDHIMTSAPQTVTLGDSTVTGLEMVDGRWPSDHAGVFSALRVR
jgi:hypothetical protein